MTSEVSKCPLSDLLELIIDHRGKTPNKMGFEDFSTTGIPVLSARHVKTEGLVDVSSMRFASAEMYKKWMSVEVEEGDIVLTSEAPMGEVFYINDNQKYLLGQRVFGLRPNRKLVDPRYLATWLASSEGQRQLAARASGSTVQGIRQSELLKIEVDLPAREQQERIAAVRFSLVDKIDVSRRINQTLEAIAQAIFKSWFVDFDPVKAKIAAKAEGRGPLRAAMTAISGKPDVELDTLTPDQFASLSTTATLFPDAMEDSELGEIPQGWSATKVEELLSRLPSKARYTKEQVSEYGQIPVFEQGAQILLGHHNGIACYQANSESPMFIFGDHTCVTRLSCQPFDISQNVIPLQGKDRATAWVYYAIKEKQKFQEYRRHWMELISKDVVVSTATLCLEFSKKISNLHLQIEANERQMQGLRELRDTLLPKLLSGELQVHNAKVGDTA